MSTNVVKYNVFYPSKLKNNKMFVVIDVVFDYSRIRAIIDYLKEDERFKFFIFSKSFSESIKDKNEIETDKVIAGLFSIKEEYDINVVSNIGTYIDKSNKVLRVVDVVVIDDFLALNRAFIESISFKQKPSIIEANLLEKSDIHTISKIAELNKWPISFLFEDIDINYIDVYETFFSFLRLKIFNHRVLKSALALGINGFFVKVGSVDDLKLFMSELKKSLEE